MGFAITSSSFATPTTTIASSANASYPAANITLTTRPQRRWKATDVTTSTYVGLDLGAATVVVAVLIDNINVASVKVQFHTADSWGAPAVDSGALTVSADARDGRYKLYYEPVAVNHRYMRVVSNTTSVTDDDTVMSVGGITLVTAKTEWSQNLQPTERPERRTLGGIDDSVALAVGSRYAVLTLSGQIIETGQESTMMNLLGPAGEHTPLVYYENNAVTSRAYLCRRVGPVSFTQPGPNHFQLDSALTLREYE